MARPLTTASPAGPSPNCRTAFLKDILPAHTVPPAQAAALRARWLAAHGLALPTEVPFYLVVSQVQEDPDGMGTLVPGCCVLAAMGLVSGPQGGDAARRSAVSALLRALAGSACQVWGPGGLRLAAADQGQEGGGAGGELEYNPEWAPASALPGGAAAGSVPQGALPSATVRPAVVASSASGAGDGVLLLNMQPRRTEQSSGAGSAAAGGSGSIPAQQEWGVQDDHRVGGSSSGAEAREDGSGRAGTDCSADLLDPAHSGRGLAGGSADSNGPSHDWAPAGSSGATAGSSDGAQRAKRVSQVRPEALVALKAFLVRRQQELEENGGGGGGGGVGDQQGGGMAGAGAGAWRPAPAGRRGRLLLPSQGTGAGQQGAEARPPAAAPAGIRRPPLFAPNGGPANAAAAAPAGKKPAAGAAKGSAGGGAGKKVCGPATAGGKRAAGEGPGGTCGAAAAGPKPAAAKRAKKAAGSAAVAAGVAGAEALDLLEGADLAKQLAGGAAELGSRLAGSGSEQPASSGAADAAGAARKPRPKAAGPDAAAALAKVAAALTAALEAAGGDASKAGPLKGVTGPELQCYMRAHKLTVGGKKADLEGRALQHFAAAAGGGGGGRGGGPAAGDG